MASQKNATIAFLTTLEGAKDVEETANAVAKNMTHAAIRGGEFSKGAHPMRFQKYHQCGWKFSKRGHVFAKRADEWRDKRHEDGLLRAIETKR